MEGELQAIGTDVIGLSEFSGDLVEVEHPFSVELLAAERHQTVVGAETHRKGFAGRSRHVRIERVDGRASDIAQRLGAGLRPNRLRLRRKRESGEPSQGKTANP